MKSSWGCALRIVVVVFFFAAASRSGAETKIPDTGAPPAALVKAALESELDGPSELRHTLLEQALARDPNFAPARWQSGFVRWDGGWLHVDEVPKRAADDKSLAAYRKMRDGMVDTADNHRALAKWCRKNKLVDEERIHWAKVLEFESGDAEALAALGLQLYDSRLLTRQQIEQEKKLAGERLRATQHWQPQIVKWRNAIEHGSGKDRDAALEKLRTLSDPGAIAPLESIFAVNGDSKHSAELNLLLIDTVARMPNPEATQVLLRRTIIPDSLEIRTAATDQLKKRPMHAYVPQLIAALPGNLKTQFHVYVLPNGMVLHEHEIFIEGQKADLSITYESAVNPADAFTAMFVTPRALNKDLRVAAAIETRAQSSQQRTDFLRNRVNFALEQTTGFTSANDPQLWEKQYNDYNGWSTPSETKPIYNQTSSIAEGSSGPLITHHSCFPAGTPVLTIRGQLPIEEIKMGDRVLAQDLNTGELAYKPVQTTTLRPATPLLKLTLGSQSILATPGHPFWVVGGGWRTAKHLNAGDLLHGMNGAVTIENLEEVRPTEVYNLVVSDFHNYFVGESRVLVHDNSPLQPVSGLPGSASLGR
jgi:hypothetical protein